MSITSVYLCNIGTVGNRTYYVDSNGFLYNTTVSGIVRRACANEGRTQIDGYQISNFGARGREFIMEKFKPTGNLLLCAQLQKEFDVDKSQVEMVMLNNARERQSWLDDIDTNVALYVQELNMVFTDKSVMMSELVKHEPGKQFTVFKPVGIINTKVQLSV